MGALDGVRVLELGEVMQAPLASQSLADLGADVIKVERPAGDPMRVLDQRAEDRGEISCYYIACNRNKRHICLDHRDGGDREALQALVATADVLIHSFRAGVVERLGLDYDTLRQRNPRLIYAVATGFGESGPLARAPGQDLLAQSISGIAAYQANPADPPRLTPTPMVDYASGMTLAQGILAALFERERSGVGQKLSISLLDTAMAMQMAEISSKLIYGFESNWVANKFPNAIFGTADGYVTVLGFFRENPLRLLCEALGTEDFSTEPAYATPEQQVEHKEEINARLQSAFAKFTRDEVLARLADADILAAPVLTLDEALSHPQVAHNQSIVTVPVVGQPDARVAGNPLRFSRTPAEIRLPVGHKGEHTEDVLAALRADARVGPWQGGRDG